MYIYGQIELIMASNYSKLTCRHHAREPFEQLADRMRWSHADLCDALIELGNRSSDKQLLDALRRVQANKVKAA